MEQSPATKGKPAEKKPTQGKPTEGKPEGKHPCAHKHWSLKDDSSAGADGIETCYMYLYKCDDCHKTLGRCTSSISGTFNEVYDQPWAMENKINFYED
jgi:hypothetical protein